MNIKLTRWSICNAYSFKRTCFIINDDILFWNQTIFIFYNMKNPYDEQIGGSHYQNFKIQPSKFVIENELLYPEGCVIKYILRHRLKGKRQDLEKAIHFIEMIIERDYSEKKDFLEEAEKEKKELEESYQEAKRQTEERKSTEWAKGYNKWKKNK